MSINTKMAAHDAEQAQAAKAVPADLRSAAERTRQDLGPTGSNYPDVRVLLAFVEQALAAHTRSFGRLQLVSTMNDTLPPLPRINHPEPHTYRFTDLERAYIEGYAMNYASKALAAVEAERDALAARPAVPAGFVLVPVEPTLEMLTAAGREDDKAFIDGMPHGATAADTWAAMLAAAPTPPAPDCED